MNTIFSAGNLEPTARVTWVTSEFHLVTLKKKFYITPFWSIPYVFNVRPKKVPPPLIFSTGHPELVMLQSCHKGYHTWGRMTFPAISTVCVSHKERLSWRSKSDFYLYFSLFAVFAFLSVRHFDSINHYLY